MIVRCVAACSVFLSLGAGASETAFREVSGSWKLEFTHRHGGSGERYMMETMVGGVVLFDFDGDADNDVLFVDGGELPGYEGPPPQTRLFRNDGGLFVDWTAASGVDFSGYGCGAAAADVDNDGDVDLYVTSYRQDALYLNRGDGRFERASVEGLPERWTSSAAFADADGDGNLDLYVAGYVEHDLEDREFCGNREKGIRGYCHPDVYPGSGDFLFRGDGRGGFVDVTESAGLSGSAEAGLGVLFVDLDDDGDADVYVANDLDPNLLFLNRGDGTFEDVSLLSGTALGDRGKAEAGMGVLAADLDGDLSSDVFVTNFALETNALYRNLGEGLFTDARFPSRLAEPSHAMLGFGTAAIDVDHDSDLDVVVANGHILDNPGEVGSATNRYEMPNQLFVNDGRGVFAESDSSGLSEIRASRGLAVGDLDLDGDQDLVIVASNARAEVYENQWGARRAAFLRAQLRGRKSNAQGIGARLTIRRTTLGRDVESRSHVVTGSSYLSQNETVVHFGLGDARAASLEVRWPSGRLQRFEGLPAGVSIVVAEPPRSEKNQSEETQSE